VTAGQAGLWVVTEPGAATPEASVLQWRLDRISALLARYSYRPHMPQGDNETTSLTLGSCGGRVRLE
jgi:hypothetical protein